MFNVKEAERFQIYHLNTEFETNIKFHWNDKRLVYLLTCKVCWKQYVGQTVDRFKLSWVRYKENNRKAAKGLEHGQAYLFNLLKTEGHTGLLNDVVLTFIDKTGGYDPTGRKQFRIRTLYSLVPNGIATSIGCFGIYKVSRAFRRM